MARLAFLALVVAAAMMAAARIAGPGSPIGARERATPAFTRVILQTRDEEAVEALVARAGGRSLRRLGSVRAVVAEVPHAAVAGIARAREVRALTPDRRLGGTLDVTSSAIRGRSVYEDLGFDGTGIGIAVIDSGVSSHADLPDHRVVHFADFVGAESQPYDGYGHGTHVAGIIAGTGASSGGARQGIAPGVHLVALKVLDHEGQGYISTAIAALDYAIAQREAFNIRVINLSVAAGVYESYHRDPLALAARRAVDAGMVVVTAAGNLGQAGGQVQYGGIAAPGNAPWVLTVGAADHNGTVDRGDDRVAPFSSRGPSAIDMVAKPDLVAPGVGIESLANPGSTLFAARPDARIAGTEGGPAYLALSGTSMAAPVVAGTIALVLQANPALGPAAVKAVLQASAEFRTAHSPLAQGAGFLDARAAVDLALAFAQNPAAARLLEKTALDTLDNGTVRGDPAAPLAYGFDMLAGAVAGCAAPSARTVRPRRAGGRGRRRRSPGAESGRAAAEPEAA